MKKTTIEEYDNTGKMIKKTTVEEDEPRMQQPIVWPYQPGETVLLPRKEWQPYCDYYKEHSGNSGTIDLSEVMNNVKLEPLRVTY